MFRIQERNGIVVTGPVYVTNIYVHILIVVLGIIACFIGILAEFAQQSVEHKGECKGPSQEAFMLGIIALACLTVAHLIFSVIGCLIFNEIRADSDSICTYINGACLCLIWIVGLVGMGTLAIGTWLNRESRSDCRFTNIHVLLIGGIMSSIHAIMCVGLSAISFGFIEI